MSTDRFLTWDFDGTLAFRPGNWTGVLTEIVAAERPDLGVTADCLRPYLQTGFPWHSPDVVRSPASAEQWWEELLPVLARAFHLGAGLHEPEARRLAKRVRAEYTKAKSWRLFDDTLPVLRELRDRGWRHIVLSDHVPELADLVDDLGLSEFFVAVYCSGRTGAEKPHPRAFDLVFVDHPGARGGWMIGDSWRADVQGAQAIGMRAILVRSRHPGHGKM